MDHLNKKDGLADKFYTGSDCVRYVLEDLQKKDFERIIKYPEKELNDRLKAIFPTTFTVIGADTGCLHPETEIYDPINKTRRTVKERFEIGKPFVVNSINENGYKTVSIAMPPKKYHKEKMLKFDDIVVTINHRFFNGFFYEKAIELQQSSFCLLPTNSESCRQELPVNAQRLTQIALSFLAGCRSFYRLCGRQLRLVPRGGQFFGKSKDDVREYIHSSLHLDDLVGGLKRIHLCQSSVLLSTLDFLNLSNNEKQVVGQCHSQKDILLPSSDRISVFSIPVFYLTLLCTALCTSLSSLVTISYYIFRGFLKDSCFNYKFVEPIPQEDEIYYDFHVTGTNNYFAGGFINHNCGKSELMGQIAFGACKQGARVVYFDFENDDGDFVMRNICRMVSSVLNKQFTVADLRMHDVENGPHSGIIYDCASRLAEKIEKMKIYKNEDLPTVDKFVEMLEMMGEEVDLVCIDHLHYFDFEKAGESQATQISRVMRALRGLTKKRIPIILASHLKERRGQNKRPSNFDLFGSSNIAKEAKNVILMHREDKHTVFQITKNRDGNTLCYLKATFSPLQRRFVFFRPDQYSGFENK